MTFVAVITGASSGIGEATARRMHAREPAAEVVIVARRQDRIDALAAELNAADPAAAGHVHPYAADLTDADAVAGLARYVAASFGRVDLLVNNAGARWSESFADGGYANVAQTMAINFDAQVRLTEALLPLLRAAAASAAPGAATPGEAGAAEPTGGSPATPARPSIVNVASTAARIGRRNAGAYSASKFALAGWSDSLYLELRREGIHVGLVLPGFIATEGFPAAELVSHPLKRHMVGTPEQAADAILRAGLEHRAEVYVPGFYFLVAAMRTLTPGVIRTVLGSGGFTTQTSQDAAANVSP
jgi:short-subunit dehydrogenase